MASQEVLTALEALHKELDKLEPAIKHVETAQLVTQIVKSIPEKHIALLEDVKLDNVKYKDELKDLFAKELISITDENKKLQKINNDIQQQIKIELEELSRVREKVQSFQEKVEKINFPERLDKMDANIAGVIAAIQSIQSGLYNLERNIAERLKDLIDYQKELKNLLYSKIEELYNSIQIDLKSLNKRNKIHSYFTWGLIILSVLIIKLVRVRFII